MVFKLLQTQKTISFTEKNPRISGPVQFKPVSGQLYTQPAAASNYPEPVVLNYILLNLDYVSLTRGKNLAGKKLF